MNGIRCDSCGNFMSEGLLALYCMNCQAGMDFGDTDPETEVKIPSRLYGKLNVMSRQAGLSVRDVLVSAILEWIKR